MRGRCREPLVQLLAKVGDLFRLILQLGLAPMAGERAGERQEGGGAANDDAVARGAFP